MPPQIKNNPRFRTLLSEEREIIFRRSKRQPWIDIADEMGIGVAQCKNIYHEALRRLDPATQSIFQE